MRCVHFRRCRDVGFGNGSAHFPILFGNGMVVARVEASGNLLAEFVQGGIHCVDGGAGVGVAGVDADALFVQAAGSCASLDVPPGM